MIKFIFKQIEAGHVGTEQNVLDLPPQLSTPEVGGGLKIKHWNCACLQQSNMF